MKKFAILISISLLASASLIAASGAAETAAAGAAEPSPTPSHGQVSGKNVRAKMEEPKRAKPVGVQNQDPTQNGRPNTSTALSPLNENSMGVGVQFDLSRPKKAAPKKADKNKEDAD
jgi:hypothetical protein